MVRFAFHQGLLLVCLWLGAANDALVSCGLCDLRGPYERKKPVLELLEAARGVSELFFSFDQCIGKHRETVTSMGNYR